MIRIERIRLPAGLRAVARRDPNGNLVIYVSAELDARRQRAAVLEAVRASRRAGWRAGLPVGIGLLGGLGFRLRRAAHAIRLRPSTWAAMSTAVAAGAVVAGIIVATAPHAHHPAAAGQPPAPTSAPSPSQPGHRHSSSGRPSDHIRPVAAGPSSGAPQPGSSSPGSGRTPPAPGPTSPVPPSSAPPTSPAPTRSATPSPSPSRPSSPSPRPSSSRPAPKPSPTGSSGNCVVILGVRVCLTL
jgi:hypothetical protein